MAEERTLKEYATSSTEESHAIIVYSTVLGNNFEIKPALIYLVQQNQFFGSPTCWNKIRLTNITLRVGRLLE